MRIFPRNIICAVWLDKQKCQMLIQNKIFENVNCVHAESRLTSTISSWRQSEWIPGIRRMESSRLIDPSLSSATTLQLLSIIEMSTLSEIEYFPIT